MPTLDFREMIGWHSLNRELIEHHKRVILDWQALLADQRATEPAYLGFLRDHAGFFLADSRQRLISISELQFGADYRADFVVGVDEASYGFTYELIELESPHDIVYTKSGNPSAELTEAINQIQKWQLWLGANRSEAKRIFPSKQFHAYDKPSFRFVIVIGRREHHHDNLHMRNHYADNLDIQIRSFDHLTDFVRMRQFHSLPINSSVEMHELHPVVRNQLANPFGKSFLSSEWRSMARSFHVQHMVAMNAETILNERQYNDRLEPFLRDWEALPDEAKEGHWEGIRFHLSIP